MVKTVRILLADDHKVVRQGTRALLSTIPEWEIVGEADNGRDAVALTAVDVEQFIDMTNQ